MQYIIYFNHDPSAKEPGVMQVSVSWSEAQQGELSFSFLLNLSYVK